MLAGFGNRFYLRTMFGVRSCEYDRLNRIVGQHLVERGPQRDLLLGCKVTHSLRLERDTTRKAQGRTKVARRFHQRLTPPAQTDNRCVEHAASITPVPVRRAA